MRAQVQEAIEHDLEDIGTFYGAAFQKPFINRNISCSSTGCLVSLKSYSLSSEATDLEKYYEENFGLNYLKKQMFRKSEPYSNNQLSERLKEQKW